MRIQYNSPVILTFSLICAAVLFLNEIVPFNLMELFTIYPLGPGAWSDPVTYFRFFSHALGHDGLGHLMGNLMLILLIGPILEEKYGSRDILMMIVITSLIIGVLQVIFFSSGLLGASGIVFMLILLASVTNFQSGKIPLTFILVLVLYLGQEISGAISDDQISQFAHIIGGIIGAIFGFALEGGQKKAQANTSSSNRV